MNDEHPDMPTGRDVAGGWLLCAVIAVLALGLVGTLHSGIPLDAAAAATTAACPSAGGTLCPAMAQAPERLGVLAGLRRIQAPMPHPGHQPHG
jgi:hypothetical protein